jgi:hypothetical protein
MDPEILQAIKTIDDKIASLQEARNRLASAFGIVSPSPTSPVSAPVIRVPLSRTAATHLTEALNGNGAPAPSGRKVQLAQFLMDHGPMSRVAIVEAAELPEGTVSYCLADKRFFQQLDGGNWDITDFSRRGLERRTKTGKFEAEGH